MALFVLPLPLGLALWRLLGLGLATDVLPHLLLDLLVAACLVPLLSGPLRGRPPLPAVYAGALLALALYVGWLYGAAGTATAGLLSLATLGVGIVLRLLRERLSAATFLRSGWMEELALAGGDVPADAVAARDARTGGRAKTWRRYVALPVIVGLLLGFVALRIARPLEKRDTARAVLQAGDPFAIGRAFLKAITNGNAPLFTRERSFWYAQPAVRADVLRDARTVFDAFHLQLGRNGLQWIDLGELPAARGAAGRTNASRSLKVEHVYGGRVRAWLEDPEAAPAGLRYVDPQRPWMGCYVWIAPLRVGLQRGKHGWRVTNLSTEFDLRLTAP